MKRLHSAAKRAEQPPDVEKRQLRRLQLENQELRQLLQAKDKLTQRQPPAEQKVLVEFGLPEKLAKPTDPFLWGKLVQQNVTLKNRVSELEKVSSGLKELLEKEKGLRRTSKAVEPNARLEAKIVQLTAKLQELQRKLGIHRQKESELKRQLKQSEQYRQQAQVFVDSANYKHGKVGAMEQQIVQLRERKRMYRQQHNDSLLVAFKEKFPIYHESVFSTLKIYKQLERTSSLDSASKASITLDYIAKGVIKTVNYIKEAVINWVRYRFYKKESYHPSNLEMVETMLEKWRNSSQSQLMNQVRFRQKQALEMMRTLEDLQDQLRQREQYVFKLQANNTVILERNRQLEEMLRYNAHDFGYTLYHKLKRYEEDRRDILAGEHSQPQEEGGKQQQLSLLVEPQYLHLKQLISTLKQATSFNREPQEIQKQKQQSEKREQIEAYIVANKHEYSHPKRQVTILRKNVYGYWEDPIFPSKQSRNRPVYKRLLDKHTQTTWESEEAERRFFRVVVYNGVLRVTNIKIDPYIKLSYSLLQKKTSPKSGREPFWNESFLFEEMQPFLTVKLFDKNKIGHDTYLGSASVDLSELFLSQEQKELRVEARIEEEQKGFIGRVWIGLSMLQRQRVIHIEEIEGLLNQEFDLLSDMDPYIEFKLDSRLVDATPVLRNGGKHPIWRQQFDLLPMQTDQTLQLSMLDQDLVKDDEIGQAQHPIGSIPEELDSMELELTAKQQKVGIVRFKVSCRQYVNSRIRKREPYLAAIDQENRTYFELGQAKMKIENYKASIGGSFNYSMAYNSIQNISKWCKGTELFWPDLFVLRASLVTTMVDIIVSEKPGLGSNRIVCIAKLDVASQLDNNFEGKEQLSVDTGCGVLNLHMNILPQAKVLFFGFLRVEFARKTTRKEVGVKIAGDDLIRLISKGPDYESEGDTIHEVVVDSSKQEIKVQVLEGFEVIATGAIRVKKILVDFITEVSIQVLNRGQKVGQLMLRMGMKTFVNRGLKQRPKEKTKLELANREYYRLLVHKAVLTRDTELLGQMQTYCSLQYGTRKWETPVQPGKNPIWDVNFTLYRNAQNKLIYQLMDRQAVGSDDLIGQGQLDLERYLNSGIKDIIGQVYYQQMGVGNLFLCLQPIEVQYVVRVTHIRAQLYEDSDWIGKIDPYVEVLGNGGLIHRTEVLDECGQNPQWKVQLDIEVDDSQSFKLETVLKDKDVIGSDYLGTAEFTLENLSEYIVEVQSKLMKEGQEFGMVYLTAAFAKFTNSKSMTVAERERPQLFDNLDLRWLHIGELSSTKGELKQPEIVYRYPFEQHANANSGAKAYFLSEMVINVQNIDLKLELYLANFLGSSALKAFFTVEEHTLKSQKQEFGVLHLSSTPIDREGKVGQHTLKVAVSTVSSMWVCYFQNIMLKDIADPHEVTVMFKSELDERRAKAGKEQKLWLFSQSGEISMCLLKHHLISEKQLGTIRVLADMLSDEYLQWRDFEVFDQSRRVGMVSARCCKVRYEKPFANRCMEALPDDSQVLGFRCKRLLSTGSTRLVGRVQAESWTQQFSAEEDLVIWCQEKSKLVFSQQNKVVGEVICEGSTDRTNTLFLTNKKRVGALQYDIISAPRSQTAEGVLTLHYIRIELSQQLLDSMPLSFSLTKHRKVYTSNTVIGRHCVFECCQFALSLGQADSIQLSYQVKNAGKDLTQTIRINYKESCYIEDKLQGSLSGSYGVTHTAGHRLQMSNEMEQEVLDTIDEIFAIETVELTLSEADSPLGVHTCNFSYAGTEQKAALVASAGRTLKLAECVYFEYRPDKQATALFEVRDSKQQLKFHSKLSLKQLLAAHSSQPTELTSQLYAGRYAIGTLSAKLKYVEKLDYLSLTFKSIVLPKGLEARDLKWHLLNNEKIIKSGSTKSEGSRISMVPSVVRLFDSSDQHLELRVESKDRVQGVASLPQDSSAQLVCLDQINGLVEYSLKTLRHQREYTKQLLPPSSIEVIEKELSILTIRSLFLCGNADETVFIRADTNDRIIESKHIKLEAHHYRTNFFELVLEDSTRLSVMRKQLSGDEVIAECKIDYRQLGSHVQKLYLKGEVAGAITFEIVRSSEEYCKLTRLAANNLKNTELLANMTPYVKITDAKGMVYRTTVALGRNNLCWDMHLLLPRSGKTLFEVMDRDMKYDDDVGKVEVDLQTIAKSKQSYDLSLKGKKEGTIEISCLSVKSKILKEIDCVSEGKGIRIVSVRVTSLRLTDKTLKTKLSLRLSSGLRTLAISPYFIRQGELLFCEEFLAVGPAPVTLQLLSANNKLGSSEIMISQIEIAPEQQTLSKVLKMASINNDTVEVGDVSIEFISLNCDLLEISQVQLLASEKNLQERSLWCFANGSRFGTYSTAAVQGKPLISFPDKLYVESNLSLTMKLLDDDKPPVTIPLAELKPGRMSRAVNLGKAEGIVMLTARRLRVEGESSILSKPEPMKSLKKWTNLKIVRAELSRDVEIFGKMDPYCIIQSNGKKYETQVQQDKGKTPTWNEDFLLQGSTRVELIVMDSQVLSDRQVGRCSISFKDTEEELKIELMYKQKPAGYVYVRYYHVSQYVRFSRFEIEKPHKTQQLSISQGVHRVNIDKASDVASLALEVPIVDKSLRIEGEGLGQLNIAIDDLKNLPRGWLATPDKMLTLAYQLFL